MPADGPEKPEDRLRGRGGAALPAKAREALGGPSAASDDAPERLRNVGVAKIPELKM